MFVDMTSRYEGYLEHQEYQEVDQKYKSVKTINSFEILLIVRTTKRFGAKTISGSLAP